MTLRDFLTDIDFHSTVDKVYQECTDLPTREFTSAIKRACVGCRTGLDAYEFVVSQMTPDHQKVSASLLHLETERSQKVALFNFTAQNKVSLSFYPTMDKFLTVLGAFSGGRKFQSKVESPKLKSKRGRFAIRREVEKALLEDYTDAETITKSFVEGGHIATVGAVQKIIDSLLPKRLFIVSRKNNGIRLTPTAQWFRREGLDVPEDAPVREKD